MRAAQPFFLGRWVSRLCCAVGASVLLAGSAGAVGTKPEGDATSRVQVRFVLPESLATTRLEHESPTRRDAMLTELGKHMQQAILPRLPDGQTVKIDVLDLKRAGSSASGTSGLRIVRGTDPPRIDLAFSVLDANGSELRAGTRKLRDMDFLAHGDRSGSDPLQYEKRLLDDWTEREFPQWK